MSRCTFILVTLLLIIPGILPGQTDLVLTAEKSIELALTNNPEIAMAEKDVSKANAGVWEAYSAVLPQLDVSANFQHAWEIQTSKIPNFIKPMLGPAAGLIPDMGDMPDFVEIAFGLENTLNYGATVTQPLFLGGAGIAGIQMARAGGRAAKLNLEEMRQDVIYRASNAFYLCLLTNEVQEVQAEALAQAEANFDIVAKKYDAGAASGFDKMRASVEVENLKPEVISARNNYQAALTQLKTVLGLDRSVIVSVQGEFQYHEDGFGDMTLSEIQELAFRNRPIINALEEQKYITRKNIGVARSNFLPKLFFQTDYSYMDMRNDYKFRQKNFSEGFTSALSLQIPIFHGFRSSSQYQQAKLDYRIMLDTEKQINDGVAAEVEISYNKFKEAKEKYLSTVETVDLATEALRLANLMYEEGANTQLDVLNSQLALTRARLSRANSLYEYQVSRYQLRKVSGQLSGLIDS